MFRTNNCSSSGGPHRQLTVFYHAEIILKLYKLSRHRLSSYNVIKSINIFGSWCRVLKFIHAFGTCRMQRFLAVLRSFINSSLLCTFSCHPSPPTILPSSLTSFCHLFLGLSLNLVVPNSLGILFSSTLCTCPNQFNPSNLIVFVIAGFITIA